jgi:hypothetical protein
MKLTRIFAGRREGELLAYPSVRRMAELLAQRCREETWVRSSVASLARFSQLTGFANLEELREWALIEPAVADQSLATFASSLADYSVDQVAMLVMGAKIWFRFNGVAVPWRPLSGRVASSAPISTQSGVEPVILLALSCSGLHMAEFLRLRIGDLGSLDVDGGLIPDIDAEPLAIRYYPRQGKQGERITFLTYRARQALLNWLASARSDGQILDPNRPLLAHPDGSPVSRASIARVRQRGRAVIQAGNNANVELCRATGDFFRRWGMPGSRFVGPEELNEEEFV